MAKIYLGLGSNLGNRKRNIASAIQKLKDHRIRVEKISRIIETEPVGGPQQGKYLNAVIKATTALPPNELLSALKSIETQLGRKKRSRNAPREIDIDILIYGKLDIKKPGLIIPHPRMLKRSFVMAPLAQIAPRIAGKLCTKRA